MGRSWGVCGTWGSCTLPNRGNTSPASYKAQGFSSALSVSHQDHRHQAQSIAMTPGNRYFYFDEATDRFIELMGQGPSRLVCVFAFMAGVLLLASVLI